MKKILLLCALGIFIAGIAVAEEWQEYKQEHFIIYYQEAPIDFVKEVEKAAETYYNEITRNLGFTRYKGWTWDERAKIYIFNDADHYVHAGRQVGWSHGSASVEEKEIRTFPSASGFFDSTLPHEIGHIVFREFIGFKANVPPWFEEGVAMYQEKAKRWGSDKIVKEAIKDKKFVPLDELSLVRLNGNSDPEFVNLFYAESASAVYFMINEYGLNRFVQLCRKLQEGGTFELGLTSVYARFSNVQELNKAWFDHLTMAKK